MERLTKRYEHYDIIDLTARTNTNCSVICHEMSDCESCPVNVALSKLADYEDAEEQGLILRLPCKVGDTVYKIWSCGKHGKSIAEFEVTRIRIDKHGIDFSILNPRGGLCRFCDIFDFGKTVFVTREEAESALAEKGGAE